MPLELTESKGSSAGVPDLIYFFIHSLLNFFVCLFFSSWSFYYVLSAESGATEILTELPRPEPGTQGGPCRWDMKYPTLLCWLHAQQVDVLGPGIEPAPQQLPTQPLEWQCQVLNPLGHRGTPIKYYVANSFPAWTSWGGSVTTSAVRHTAASCLATDR